MSSQHEEEQVLVPTSVTSPRQSPRPAIHTERIALVDLLDRVLAGGVVLSGEVTLAIADVDMVRVSLRALVTSASALIKAGDDEEGGCQADELHDISGAGHAGTAPSH